MARRQPLAMGLDVLERKAAQEVRRAVGLKTRQDALRYAVRVLAYSLRSLDDDTAVRGVLVASGGLPTFYTDEKRRLEIARRGGRA